jgi:iron complex transport system permease protein
MNANTLRSPQPVTAPVLTRFDPHSRTVWLFLGLGIAALAVLALSIATGSVGLSWNEVWAGLTGREGSFASALIYDLRLPRALTAFAAGGVLAIAGVLMQVLLRNPLADPFIMGVSGGAAVGALAAILIGATGSVIDAAAMLGALASTLLVFTLAHGRDQWGSHRLLLTGVVLASGTSAIVSMMLAVGEESLLRGMLFWLMGDLSMNPRPARLLIALGVGLAVTLPFARDLNILAHGEVHARVLGLSVQRLRMAIFIASSLLTGVAVSTAGTIGFVGLLTPHLVRLLVGADHRRVLPAAAILGGTLVMVADLIARSAFAPRQLPVGAVTAVVGVPLFLFLMHRRSSRVAA